MISVRTDIAVLIKMNVCPTMDMDRVRSELSLSYLPPDKVKVMLMCTAGQVHEHGRLLPLLVPRPTRNTSLLRSSLVRGDRHVRTRQRRLQPYLHIHPWTGQLFFNLLPSKRIKKLKTVKRKVVKVFELNNFYFQSCSIFHSVWLVGHQLRTFFPHFEIFAPM